MKAANAHPVALPSSHLHEALRSGAVDVILTSYDNFLRLRLYEHAAFATFGGKHSLWTYFSPILISKRLWDNLSVEDREAMTAAAEVSNQYFAQAQLEAEARAVAVFQQAGAKVNQVSSEDHDGWLALAQRTSWMQYAQGRPVARELLLSAVRAMLMSRDAGDASAESPGQGRRAAGWMLTAFLVLISPNYPWYFLVLVPFLALSPSATAWVLTSASVLFYDIVPGDVLPVYETRVTVFTLGILAALACDLWGEWNKGAPAAVGETT